MNLRVRRVAPSSTWNGLAIERNREKGRWWRCEIFLNLTSRNFHRSIHHRPQWEACKTHRYRLFHTERDAIPSLRGVRGVYHDEIGSELLSL